MLSELGTEVVIIIALILTNGFFAGAEIAIVSTRRGRLEAMSREGSRGARQALNLADNPDRFLATVQIGITFIGTFSAAFGGARVAAVLTTWLETVPALQPYAQAVALAIVVGLITYLSLVLGELVPKRLALRNAEGFAVIAAPVMTLLAFAGRPLVAFLTLSVNLIFRLLGSGGGDEDSVTEEDIIYMVSEGIESGEVEADAAQLIRRVFQFTDRPLYTMMTPRTRIVAVSVDAPLPQIVETFAISGHSRLPVYKSSLDHVVGILYIRDVFRLLAEGREQIDIHRLLHPAVFLVETAHADDLLPQFQQQGMRMAMVIDEHGQVAGLLTLQDMLEELVGEIHDESDQDDEAAYFQRGDGSWLVDGLETYDRVCQTLGVEPPEDESIGFSSIAGLILSELGRIPSVGDAVTIDNLRLEVVDMDKRRIDKVLIYRVDPDKHQPES